eukprot:604219-Prorocentrum_lima.AAC.1
MTEKHVGPRELPEDAALYLSNTQWAEQEGGYIEGHIPHGPPKDSDLEWHGRPFEIAELKNDTQFA